MSRLLGKDLNLFEILGLNILDSLKIKIGDIKPYECE